MTGHGKPCLSRVWMEAERKRLRAQIKTGQPRQDDGLPCLSDEQGLSGERQELRRLRRIQYPSVQKTNMGQGSRFDLFIGDLILNIEGDEPVHRQK